MVNIINNETKKKQNFMFRHFALFISDLHSHNKQVLHIHVHSCYILLTRLHTRNETKVHFNMLTSL